MRLLDKLEFMLSEAFVALRRNGLMTFAAISTMAVSLFLIGGLSYTYLRIQDYAKSIPDRFEMRVWLKDDVRGEARISQAATHLRAVHGVAKVTWIPSDKNWELQKQLHPDITEGIDNPLPEGFKVQVSDLALSDEVAEAIEGQAEVAPKGVVYLKAEQDMIERILHVIRWLGSVLGGLLFITGGILIYNAIHMTVQSRRLEIRIMRLVGASQITIRVPFLIEGLVQGAIGGVLASLMVLAMNSLVVTFVHQNTIAPETATPVFPFKLTLILLCGIGALYGLFCSVLAVRAPLREP